MSEYIVNIPSILNRDGVYYPDERNDPMPVDEEIVRCRDCARFVPQGTYRFNSGAVNKDTCEVIRGFVVQIDPNGFCAWGERK